jgi:nitroreductase
MTQITVREALLGRTTIHDYAAQPLPAGAVSRALETALAAPNHRMTEPWRFIRIGKEARQKLAQLSVELKARKSGNPLSPRDVERQLAKFTEAPELFAVLETVTEDAAMARENYAAVACAIQNFCLSLWSEGIGSKWSTGAVTSVPETYALLGVDATRLRIVGFLWAGMAAAPTAKPRRRNSVADIFSEVP